MPWQNKSCTLFVHQPETTTCRLHQSGTEPKDYPSFLSHMDSGRISVWNSMCSFDVHLWLKIMNSDTITLNRDDKETHQGQRMPYSETSTQPSNGKGSVRKLKSDKFAKMA